MKRNDDRVCPLALAASARRVLFPQRDAHERAQRPSREIRRGGFIFFWEIAPRCNSAISDVRSPSRCLLVLRLLNSCSAGCLFVDLLVLHAARVLTCPWLCLAADKIRGQAALPDRQLHARHGGLGASLRLWLSLCPDTGRPLPAVPVATAFRTRVAPVSLLAPLAAADLRSFVARFNLGLIVFALPVCLWFCLASAGGAAGGACDGQHGPLRRNQVQLRSHGRPVSARFACNSGCAAAQYLRACLARGWIAVVRSESMLVFWQ